MVTFRVTLPRSVMLRVLRIENLAVVASAEIDFGAGLNLLTGETGAGKSIVVDALSLVSGEKADAGLVRTGEERGTIEAIFDAPASLDFEALGLGIDVSEGEVAIRRELSPSGRSRATVNGVTVPVSVLRSIGSRLIQIHGQHQHHALLEPAVHLRLLDRYAGLSERADKVSEHWQAVQASEKALSEFRTRAKDWARERDALQFQVGEIRKAGLSVGEEEKLREERARLRNAERLRELGSEALALLDGDDDSVLVRLKQARKRIDELERIDPTAASESARRREEIESVARDWAADLETYLGALDSDPRRMDEVESRLSDLERLKKKYGSSIQEIMNFCTASELKLGHFDDPEAREKELAWDVEQKRETYARAAMALSEQRRSAARKLEKAVARELAELAMQACRFAVGFAPADSLAVEEWRTHEPETAEFFLSANPGEDPRPLGSVASGGELSRSLLALQALMDSSSGATIVFDEVDAGIGGAVAEAVGRRLGRVAESRQVLCVTHLAQVAAFADHHYLVEKRVARGRTLTEVTELSGRDREREIARMLAGETITKSAEDHARDLMQRVRDKGKPA